MVLEKTKTLSQAFVYWGVACRKLALRSGEEGICSALVMLYTKDYAFGIRQLDKVVL